MSDNTLYTQCDFHIHTHLSGCANRNMLLPDILNVCASRGIKYLGVTDHIFAYTDPVVLDETLQEAAMLSKPMEVFIGCEADILSVGRHTVTEEMKRKLDYISVSHNHFWVEGVTPPASVEPAVVAKHYIDTFRYACSLPWADVVVHPMVVASDLYDPASMDLLTDDQIIEALQLARANNIAVEISPRAFYPEQMEFRIRFLSLCKEEGLKFSIGSDGHTLEQVGQTNKLAPLIEQLGVVDEDIWLPSRKNN